MSFAPTSLVNLLTKAKIPGGIGSAVSIVVLILVLAGHPMIYGSSLFCVGNIRTRVDPERFAAVNQEAGITRFARPSALIPFLV